MRAVGAHHQHVQVTGLRRAHAEAQPVLSDAKLRPLERYGDRVIAAARLKHLRPVRERGRRARRAASVPRQGRRPRVREVAALAACVGGGAGASGLPIKSQAVTPAAPMREYRRPGRAPWRESARDGVGCGLGGGAGRAPRSGFPRDRSPLEPQETSHGGRILRAVLRLGRHAAIERLQERRAVTAGGCLRERHERVGDHPRDRRRRRLAHDREVRHRGERIDVRPRPLLHRRRVRVLLDRGIARLENHREGLAAVPDHAPRGAEVEQHRPRRSPASGCCRERCRGAGIAQRGARRAHRAGRTAGA